MFAPRRTACLAACAIVFAAQAGRAADIEEIVVTGSRILRDPAASPSPLSVVTADDLSRAGFTSVADAVRLLPANIGSEFNTDVFTQNLSVGTSNFNLRGLGLNATLVLLNGRRQTMSGGVADDGSTFVDLNALMPMIMLQRLEVLKDGAAALYGSDAVAGVANYITRDDFTGAEARIENGTTTRSGQNDLTVSGLIGRGNDRWHVVAGASYLHRSPLSTRDRAFTAGKAFSSFGQPGAFSLLSPSPAYPDLPVGSAFTVIDPACGGAAGGIPNPRNPQPAGVTSQRIGTCTFDFSSYYDLVAQERKWNTYATGHIAASDSVELFSEVGYARDRISRGTSPSFPILNLVTVPADNPGNVFRTPVLFLGRALGATAGRDTVTHASDTWRGVVGARGDLGAWHWDVTGTYSANAFYVGIHDVLADRFIAALNGRGGPNNNQYFNPFGSAATARPGDATYNDPAVVRDFVSVNSYDYTASLAALDASVSGKLGNIGIAAGGQLRRETFHGNLSDAANAERFLFSIGGPDFGGARTVWALFAEAQVPITARLEAQLALRHEDGGGSFSSTDPKIGLLWRPTDGVSLRGSFATSFRAPSVFQTSAVQVVLENIADPLTGTTSFRGVRTRGAAALLPEQANVANVGVTLAPLPHLTLSADAWRYDYTDIIVKQSAQALVNANPLDARIQRQAGQIVRIDTSYINASKALTDGLDLAAKYRIGDVSLTGEGTYLRRFLIQDSPTAAVRDVAGNRNFTNFARSLPKWRGQAGATWQHDRHTLGMTVRIVGSYRDDQNANRPIAAQATLDAQYTLALGGIAGARAVDLTLGAQNLTDKDPPPVLTNAGYDSKVHDPRGRVVYVRLRAGW